MVAVSMSRVGHLIVEPCSGILDEHLSGGTLQMAYA